MDLVHGVGDARSSVPEPFAPNGGSNEPRDVFHVTFDPQTEPVVEVVVNAVAVIHNAEPTALEPLGSAIDVDALSALIEHPSTGHVPIREVVFVYEHLEITVTSDGHVWLEWA